MSTLAESHFPPPRSWDAFEGMVLDVFRRVLRNPSLKRFGRLGQRQHGVDISGPHINGMLGIQCKHHPGGKITNEEIDAEIREAETFSPPLTQFIIATSVTRDARVSEHASEVNISREAEGKFGIDIYFWDDILHELVRHSDLLAIHFPELKTAASVKAEEDKATELARRKRLADHQLPNVGRAQIIWDERFSGDDGGEFFDHEMDELCGALLTIENVLKLSLQTRLILADDPMLARMRTLLRRTRDLMAASIRQNNDFDGQRFRADGQAVIDETRRALLDFAKEQEEAEAESMRQFVQTMEANVSDFAKLRPGDW